MPSFAKGRIAWGICQRCGLRYLLNELVLDGYYPNIRVCPGCYDAPQPQERLAVVSDPVALWKPAVDTYGFPPPFLTITIVAGLPVLTWTSIMGPLVGADTSDGIGGIGGYGPYLSAGYQVYRSLDGVTFTQVASFTNTADEFGALAVETLTWTDPSPPQNQLWYYVRGYDINENAENG